MTRSNQAPAVGRGSFQTLRMPYWMVVLIAAAAVRLCAAAQLGCISRDGVQFVTLAKRLAVEPAAALADTLKQPGFSALMLLVNRVAINEPYQEHPLSWQACGQVLAVAGGVACCLLLYALTIRLFDDKRTALAAGLLAAVWPQGVLLSADVLSDTTHLALYLAAFLAGLSAIKRGRLGRFALCGALAGVAYIVRQEAMGLPIAVACCALWPAAIPLRRRMAGVGLMLLACAAMASPPSIATGKLMPNKNLRDLLFGAADEATAAVTPRDPLQMFTRHVPEPDRLASFREAHVIPWYQAPARMAEEWCRSGRYVISTLALIALFLKSVRRPEPTGARLVVAAVALQVIAVQLRVSSYGEISSRYLVIPAALCIPWAGAALATLAPLLAGRFAVFSPVGVEQERRRLQSIWLSMGIIVFAPLLFYATRPASADRAAYKLAGWYLRQNTKMGQHILAHDRLEFVMFYGGRTWPDLSWRPYEQPPSERVEAADAVVIRRLAQLRGLLADLRPEYFLDARASRQGGTTGDEEYFDALVRGDVAGLTRIWSSGPSEHEVFLFRYAFAADDSVGRARTANPQPSAFAEADAGGQRPNPVTICKLQSVATPMHTLR